MPKLSIIVTAFNDEKYLDRCLKSIKNQTFKDFECIIIDDGSVDKTNLIAQYFSLIDDRFKLISKYNSGVADSRNVGLSIAKGEWIGFVDGDDEIALNRFNIALKAAKEHNVDFVKCDIIQKRINGTESKWPCKKGKVLYSEYKVFKDLVNYDVSGVAPCLYKKRIIDKNHLTFCQCDFGEDFLFNVQYFFHAKAIYFTNTFDYIYYRHADSLSKKEISKERLDKIKSSFEYVLDYISNDKKYRDIIENNFKNRNIIQDYLSDNTIDLVMPYVNSNDPIWQADYNIYNGGNRLNEDVNGKTRFSSNQQMLKYVFRGIAKFMPWIRTVHLLVSTASQVPDWVNKNNVDIVTHKQFIPKELLPTFNSSTIEMFLANIPDLSEKFIYANDDFYYTYDLKQKFYFTNDDKIKTHLQKHPLINPKSERPIWQQLFINSYNLIFNSNVGESDYKENYYIVPPHIEQGMLLSEVKKTYELYKQQMYDSCTRFRSDKNLNQYLYTYQTIKDGLYEDGVHSNRNFNTNANIENIISAIENPDKNKVIRSFVLNDVGSFNYNLIKNSFEKILSEKCKYEN